MPTNYYTLTVAAAAKLQHTRTQQQYQKPQYRRRK